MKRILFVVAFSVAATFTSNAQNWAAKAGFGSLGSSMEGSSSVTGFGVGVSADFEMTESINVQPEIMYNIFDGGGLVSIPVLAKYYVAEKFSVLGGPQVNYTLADMPEEFSPLGVGIAAGGAYDINDQFFVDARYNAEVTNRFNGESDFYEGKLAYNLFSVGVGYRF